MAEKLGPIPANEGRNWTGICHMDVLAVQDVLSVPEEVDGYIAGTVAPKSGIHWSRVYFDADGGNYTEKWPVENGAQSSRATLSGQVLRDQLPYLRQFWAAKGRRYIVLATTRNGDQLLMGTLQRPAILLVSERTAGAEIGSDTNRYEVAFALASRRPVPFYGGAAPAPPPPGTDPGATCPGLAELLPQATVEEILGGITEEQAMALAAHFGTNCPSLADLLATVSDAALFAALSLAQATYIANQVITVIDGNGDAGDVVIDPGGGGSPPTGAHYSPLGYSPTGYKTT